MVMRMEIIFVEIVYVLDFDYVNPSFQIFKLPPRVNEITEINITLPTSITISIHEIRSRIAKCHENDILKFNKAIIFQFNFRNYR